MNINRTTSRRSFLLAAFAAVVVFCASPAHAFPPDPITDLTVSPGTATGSLQLSWTARSGDGLGVIPATRYIIKYRYNQTITTEPQWDNAYRIEEPPVNLAPPSPGSVGSAQTLLVTGLEPGTRYGFMVRAVDAAGVIGQPLSNSATAQATAPCPRDPLDGAGTNSISVIPSTLGAGNVQVTTASINISGTGINTGGKIAMRVPDFFPWPQQTNPSQSGHVSYSITPAGPGLVLTTDEQTAVLTVSSGTIPPGSVVNFYYRAQTCQVGFHRFRYSTQFTACGVLTDTGLFTNLNVPPGPSHFVDFKNFDLAMILGQTTPVDFRVTDFCGNSVPLTASATIPLSAVFINAANVFPASQAFISLTSSPFTNTQSVMLNLASGAVSGRAYYKITTFATKPNDRIQIIQTDLQNPQGTWPRFATIRPLVTGITNSSVDTGAVIAGQKTVTFTPDSDGLNDTVAINFTIPESMPWSVEISSDGFVTITRRFFGDVQEARVIWDGFSDGGPGNPPSVAPSGTYAVRISLGGSIIVDNSLSATLSAAGVQGFVQDTASNPLANVDIQIFGPTNRFARTNGAGNFVAHGLKGGTYQIRYQKTGFATVEVTASPSSGVLTLPNATLTKETVLKLVVTRPQSDRMDEVWGQARANNVSWTKQAWGTVHFGRGKDLGDAGDLYNVEPTSFTALTLTPGVQYRIHFDVPNLSVADFNVMLGTTDVTMPVSLIARANIEGTVQLATGTNPSGTWISVEAGPDANSDLVYDNQDPSKRYWGGAYLAANETSGVYRIFGVANGTYAVVASAPNFIPLRANVTISNDQNGFVNFAPLSVGGTVTGTVTVPGDSSSLDGADGVMDGYFTVPINAWSSSLQTGSYRQVRLQTDATLSFGTFTLTGLQDGLYEVYTNLPGYELNPPGRRTVTVTGGIGALLLAFQPYTGGLTGQITLPNPFVNFGDTEITLRAYDWNVGTFSDPVITGAGVYTFSNLGTGFYLLRAKYLDTGFVVEKNVQIVNGVVATSNLDLSGATYSISGRVSSSARSPYNTVDFLVYGSTPTQMEDTTDQSADILPANRIVVERIQRNDSEMSKDTDPSHYNSQTYIYGTYDDDGDFNIPNLTPGSYSIRNNDELDDTFTNGAEVAQTTRIVKILTASATGQDIEITDGFTVSGTIRVADGSTPARDIRLELKNAAGALITAKDVFMSASEMTFSLDRVPSGDYVLAASDQSSPKAYAAKDVRAVVDGASLTNVQIDLLKAARIRGKMRIDTSGILLTSRNFEQFLTGDFYIEARSNPWFNGGYARAIEPLIDADGNFSIFSNPGKYDIHFKSRSNLSPQDISQGKKQFVPLQISGIEIAADQSFDLGVVKLIEGTALTGTIENKSGQPVPNVLVIARPSGENDHNNEPIQAVSNELGEYTLQGIDSTGKRFYDVIAAPRAQDGRFQGFTGTVYGEIRRTQIDTRLTTPIDFVVEPALGVVRGRLVTADGGDLETPFDHDQQPGGVVIMNRVGTIPADNPLGDIEENSLPDGTFEIRGLVPGTYSLWGLAQGYSNGLRKNIPVGTAPVDVGDITLQTGFKLSGELTRADGSAPNESDVDTLVAVRNGFEELLIGSMVKDAAGTIVGYEISGFQATKAYTVLVFDKNDDILVLGEGIIVDSDTERNFTLTEVEPTVLAQASKAQDGSVVIQFDFTSELLFSSVDLDDNGIEDANEPEKIFTLNFGDGALNFPVDCLAFDRRRAQITYAPTSDDTRFTITVTATFATVDPATGENHTVTKAFPFFLGIGEQKEEKFTNAGGGVVLLRDSAEFSAQAGTFGANADDTVTVIFRAADDSSDFSGAAAAPQISGAMGVASTLGLKAYPPEMGGAINRARTAAVNPFGSFYDIFLPAGVSHFFPEGKEARLCVAYDPDVADPYALNVYYYNAASNEYLLESENKAVDPDNSRICVSLSHASVFTVLNSSASVISGAGYSGELTVMNFPNPFDLKAKAVTLQDPGSASAAQTINGTMIKVSVPGDIAGALEIEIFSVSGEKVRTIHDNIPAGGAHYYVPWDGTNDSGAKVASGTYVARMTIGGGNEKFFKMAVIK